VQSYGVGALKPNTLLLGWPTDPARVESFGAILRVVAALGRSIVAIRTSEEEEDPWEIPPGTVDVWWRGKSNGPLMLLLAHLLVANNEWRNRPIRLMRVAPADAARSEMTRHLTELIETSRIRATAEVIVADDPAAAIQNASRDAAVVFLGFEAPAEGDELAFFESMQRMAGDLERVIFVDSAGGMELDS